MVGSLITSNGKKVHLYRTYTETANLSSTQYLAPTQFKIGVDGVDPLLSDNDLTTPIPITDGTVLDDGSNTFTGSGGADNSTDNTTTFKEGAGTTDDTAQNLIGNLSSATKTWIIASLTNNADSTQYIGLHFYIKDSTALAKFLTSGTCLELRLGVDSTTNYYSKVLTAADLVVGWNWLDDSSLLSTWTVVGTPGTLNDYTIIITTNNATDTFVAGDIVVDLLRQWESTDLVKDFASGYPTLNMTNLNATTRSYLTSIEANGFLISRLGHYNKDTSVLMVGADNLPEDSKSSTDEFAYVVVDRIL